MYNAYFDESGESATTAGYYGIAGFVAPESGWRNFNQRWIAALESCGVQTLHVRDLSMTRGWDKAKHDKFACAVVDAINTTELTAIGAVLSLEDFHALPTEDREKLRHPYFVCFQEVVTGFLIETYYEPSSTMLHIIGSRQKEHEAGARQIWNIIDGVYDTYASDRDAQRPRFLSFDDPTWIPGLQAADLLAYEMTRHMKVQDRDPSRNRRWTLDQILGHQVAANKLRIKFIPKAYMDLQLSGTFEQQIHGKLAEWLEDMRRIYRPPAKTL